MKDTQEAILSQHVHLYIKHLLSLNVYILYNLLIGDRLLSIVEMGPNSMSWTFFFVGLDANYAAVIVASVSCFTSCLW